MERFFTKTARITLISLMLITIGIVYNKVQAYSYSYSYGGTGVSVSTGGNNNSSTKSSSSSSSSSSTKSSSSSSSSSTKSSSSSSSGYTYSYQYGGVGVSVSSTPNKLTYNANGGTGAPGQYNMNSSAKNIYLSNKVPTRKGYKFLGWSENPNATVATYKAGGAMPNPKAGKTLYAVWEKQGTGTTNTNTGNNKGTTNSGGGSSGNSSGSSSASNNSNQGVNGAVADLAKEKTSVLRTLLKSLKNKLSLKNLFGGSSNEKGTGNGTGNSTENPTYTSGNNSTGRDIAESARTTPKDKQCLKWVEDIYYNETGVRVSVGEGKGAKHLADIYGLTKRRDWENIDDGAVVIIVGGKADSKYGHCGIYNKETGMVYHSNWDGNTAMSLSEFKSKGNECYYVYLPN